MKTKTKKKRIFYFDALRTMAILCVILIHCFNSVTIGGGATFFSAHPSLSWVAAAMFGNFDRIGVDLFLMLSGALSLGREWKIRDFLGRRIPRIVLPFLFWGFVLCVAILIFNMYIPDVFKSIGHWDLLSFLNYLKDCYLANNYAFAPYWFFWMILGTYLIMPIYNKWLLHADLKEAEYFLVIWAVTSIYLTVGMKCPIKLDYFAGAVGMVVLGYYLRHTERKIFKNPYFIVSLLIVALTLVFLNSFGFSMTGQFQSLNRYNIFLAMEVVAIFLLFRYLSEHDLRFKLSDNSPIRKGVFSIAKYSYGLYLIHRPIITALRSLIGSPKVYSFIVILFVLTVIIAWFAMACLNRVPYLNKIIGAK